MNLVEGLSVGITIGGVLVTVGILVGKVRSVEEEVKRLREWRHDVGDRPGFAALVRNEEHDRRLSRIERALNGLLSKYPLETGPPRP